MLELKNIICFIILTKIFFISTKCFSKLNSWTTNNQFGYSRLRSTGSISNRLWKDKGVMPTNVYNWIDRIWRYLFWERQKSQNYTHSLSFKYSNIRLRSTFNLYWLLYFCLIFSWLVYMSCHLIIITILNNIGAQAKRVELF